MKSKFDAAHSEYWTIDSNQAVQRYFQDPAWMTTFVQHSLPRGSSVLGQMKIAKRTREAKVRGNFLRHRELGKGLNPFRKSLQQRLAHMSL